MHESQRNGAVEDYMRLALPAGTPGTSPPMQACVAGCVLSVIVLFACSPAPVTMVSTTHPMCMRADMTELVLTHPIPRMSGPANPVVTRVIAATAAEINRTEHMELTIPADTPVCYVELSGPFVVFGPPGKSTSYARGFEVFRTADWQLVASGAMN
jgi:hypothetical protein